MLVLHLSKYAKRPHLGFLILGIGLGFHVCIALETLQGTLETTFRVLILGIGLGFHLCIAPFKVR